MAERPILFSGHDRARFLAKVCREGDCWKWTGSLNEKGYGRFYLDGQMTTAQRAAHLLFKGPVLPGYTVDHTHSCGDRACVNPEYLEAVPHRVNLLRGNTVAARAAAATACPRGHPYDDANTLRRRGKRGCRDCERARAAARYIPRGKQRRRRPHLTRAERAEIRVLVDAGLSHSEIADRLSVSTATVSRVRNAT